MERYVEILISTFAIIADAFFRLLDGHWTTQDRNPRWNAQHKQLD